jgi:hypothetical protein
MGRTSVSFPKELVASGLWDYGENHLVDRALGMSDRDLRCIWQLAAQYEDVTYPLPDPGQGITHNHVIAYAAVTHFEGHLRPLARGRRRPQKDRPAHLVRSYGRFEG